MPSKYVGDENAAGEIGTTCIVDTVVKKGRHIELDLMSVSPDEAASMQLEPDKQSAEEIARKCAAFGKGLALFFMYKGVPYAASNFSTEEGRPPTLTMEPWADVDEDADEIRAIAEQHMANGLI